MSDGLKSILRKAAFAAALAIGLGAGAAQAATLYISEFATPVSQVGTTVGQVYPQPAITDQAVSISGSSTQSAAFGATTHAVQVECDTDCSVVFGSNPTATTTNYLMGDGIPYQFAVIPGQKIAVIANTSGGSGTDINIAAVGGTPVTSPLPVSSAGSANLATGQVSVANTATLIAALRSGRQAITIVNTAATAVYLGNSTGVTTSTGTLLPGIVGASVTMNTQSAIYGISATGSETVTEFETY